MNQDSFFDNVAKRCGDADTHLCVGIDPKPELVRRHNGGDKDSLLKYCLWMLDETAEHAAIFKPNLGFFLQFGLEGLEVLREIVAHIHKRDLLVLLDAKLGDIGPTAEAYARFLQTFSFDAVTASPYLGSDSVLALAPSPKRAAFVLARTSNPSALQVQDYEGGDGPLYLYVAHMCNVWDVHGNLGLVTGATYPQELAAIRKVCPDRWLLLPGIGKQGGDLDAAVAAAHHNFIINVSSAINGSENPGAQALFYRNKINEALRLVVV